MKHINQSQTNSYYFQNLDAISGIQELPDEMAATCSGGAVANFGGGIPSIGSVTYDTVYATTSQFKDITIRMTENPEELIAKAVSPDGRDLGLSQIIPKNYKGNITLASNVKDGTPFKLDFDAPTLKSFDISGRMTY